MAGRKRKNVTLRTIAETATARARAVEAARTEALAVARGLEETAGLEVEQGGAAVRGKHGPLRLPSRDGLRTLHDSGALEGPEYEAGLLYRKCFEALAGGPKSCLNRDLGAGLDGFAELRAVRAERLARWEVLAASGRQLWVLRLVAGQARTISNIGRGASSRVINTRALVEVLTAIARERGLRR